MSELRQYHPSLRVLQIKQTKNGWNFIGDTPKDFSILLKISLSCRVRLKGNKFSGQKLRCHYRGHITLKTPQKVNFWYSRGVSINITINEFNELLGFNKITHAEAERMKSKRTGRELPLKN